TLCDWTGLGRAHGEIIAPALRAGFASARPPVPLEVLRLPIPLAPAEFHTIAVNFARAKDLAAKPRFRFPAPGPDAATRRLKIGYVSSDFGDHPVGHIVGGLFPHHDRQQFETVAYALSPDDRGPERRRLASAVDRLVDLSTESRAEAARRIHAD